MRNSSSKSSKNQLSEASYTLLLLPCDQPGQARPQKCPPTVATAEMKFHSVNPFIRTHSQSGLSSGRLILIIILHYMELQQYYEE